MTRKFGLNKLRVDSTRVANDDHHLSFWPMGFLSYLGLGLPWISYPYNYHLLGWK